MLEAASTGACALVAGALMSAAAAVAHLACIVLGANAYRAMGAGERMARAVEAGKLRPTLVTIAVASVLFVWSAYALSGAGVLGPLPLTRPALFLIALVLLARAVAFPLLKPSFPENSNRFWWTSSSICAVMGLLYGYGAMSTNALQHQIIRP